MARGSRRILHAIVLLSATAGLGACQSSDIKPQLQATAAPAPGMDSDIQKILVAGGLNANAPGSLQTAKMPAEVQQAVAALQGAPMPANAAAVPVAGVTQIAAVETSSPLPLVTPVNGKPAPPPMLAALQATGGRNRRGRHAPAQYALAPVPAQVAPQVPMAAPPQMAPQQVASNENLSQVRSYLPTMPPQTQTIVLTGPNAHPRYSVGGGGGNSGGVAIPSVRATQAAVRVMQAPAPVAATAPAPTPEPESPRVRRF